MMNKKPTRAMLDAIEKTVLAYETIIYDLTQPLRGKKLIFQRRRYRLKQNLDHWRENFGRSLSCILCIASLTNLDTHPIESRRCSKCLLDGEIKRGFLPCTDDTFVNLHRALNYRRTYKILTEAFRERLAWILKRVESNNYVLEEIENEI